MKINKYNDFRNISGSVVKELRLKANLSQQNLKVRTETSLVQMSVFNVL